MSVSFWLEGVAMPAVSVFGLLGEFHNDAACPYLHFTAGNLVSIRILHSRHSSMELNPSFTNLLICLVS